MSFKFGFDLPSTDKVDGKDRAFIQNLNQNETNLISNTNTSRAPITRIEFDHLIKNLKKPINAWLSNDFHFEKTYFCTSLQRIAHDEKPFDFDHNKQEEVEEDALFREVNGNETDIIPGKYEGGLKVWECSIDLCHYLAEQISLLYAKNTNREMINKAECTMDVDEENDVKYALSNGGTIIELGCGHGLPGCLLLKEIVQTYTEKKKSEASSQSFLPRVIFTDYNSFVLRDVTLPNILLNCLHDSKNEEKLPLFQRLTALYAGDWMNLSETLRTNPISDEQDKTSSEMVERFDLILASETTYTNSASQETACWLKRHLKFGTGVGLVSMKRYYFGVGGGSDAFMSACKSHGLTFELVREFNDGASNIRDLWRVRLPLTT